MPIQHAIWQVGQQPTPLTTAKLASEQQLEDLIVREPAIVSSQWMLIGPRPIDQDDGTVRSFRVRAHVHIRPFGPEPQHSRGFPAILKFCIGK